MPALSGITGVELVSVMDGGLVDFRTPGEVLGHAQPVRLNSSDSKYYKAQATSLTNAKILGLTLTPAASTSKVLVLLGGGVVKLTGPTLVTKTAYVVGAVAGEIVPLSDLVATNHLTIVGYAISASELLFLPQATGYTIF